MTAYALIIDNAVANIIELDTDPADFHADGQLVPLADHHNGQWGIGWDYIDGTPVDNRPPAPEPEPEGPSPLALLQAQVDELTDLTMELLMGT